MWSFGNLKNRKKIATSDYQWNNPDYFCDQENKP